jgi:hypothetical protein
MKACMMTLELWKRSAMKTADALELNSNLVSKEIEEKKEGSVDLAYGKAVVAATKAGNYHRRVVEASEEVRNNYKRQFYFEYKILIHVNA